MEYGPKSLRTFVGAKDFELSRQFYRDLGLTEVPISGDMVLFTWPNGLSFYLQDYYVRDWVDNSMLFLEVADVERCLLDLEARGLVQKYPSVRLSKIKKWDWGREIFLHDPSGILWHFGEFFETGQDVSNT
ncbi:MAG: glyoxalase [Flavobacteriaceae bacterium]